MGSGRGQAKRVQNNVITKSKKNILNEEITPIFIPEVMSRLFSYYLWDNNEEIISNYYLGEIRNEYSEEEESYVLTNILRDNIEISGNDIISSGDNTKEEITFITKLMEISPRLNITFRKNTSLDFGDNKAISRINIFTLSCDNNVISGTFNAYREDEDTFLNKSFNALENNSNESNKPGAIIYQLLINAIFNK